MAAHGLSCHLAYRTLLALVLGTANLAPAWATPRQVILLRHGDKVASGADNYNLSPNGFLRAINLARLIPACFGGPTHIRTFFLNPVTSKNARSYQSAVPLAVATGINISSAQVSQDDSFLDGQEILRQPAYRDGNVVLFWEHRRMPDLARGLGWPSMPPIGPMEFDQIFVLHYDRPEAAPRVESLSQSQLFEALCFRQASSPLPQVPLPR
ncbi:hypothetical protein [Synechococcus sp. CS-1328]|uniref:hypothetical protein n=1 Tax=Synechococcus sp. CS-1328 TaxID=2847976 RepID=UPI00223B9695|nr:hypothetical protein [Synechococcus sp. CS-1328]MCT0226363.1 hypothetical protein [Synechococcus sp. CS-1328]